MPLCVAFEKMRLNYRLHFQVNWGSFLDNHSRTTEKMAVYLAAKGYIHCLATDSHDANNRNARQMRQATEKIDQLIGRRNLHIISRENPNRVLRNEALENMEKPEIKGAVKKKRDWRFWRNRAEGSRVEAQG